MSKNYFEMRYADYTLRIANLDAQRTQALKKGQLLQARGYATVIAELERKRHQLKEEYGYIGDVEEREPDVERTTAEG